MSKSTLTAQPSVVSNNQPYQRLSQVKSTDNGIITFKLGNNPTFTAYASPLYGGGWILVAQYIHQGGTNPPLRSIAPHNNLPNFSTTPLGGDDSANNALWGEISPAFLQAFPDLTSDLELRFVGQTSGHSRFVNFKTDAVISRWRDNTGTMLDVNFQYTLLTGHTANLPRSANNTFNQQNINQFPFYSNATYHWGISGYGTRWEVDDFPNNFANSTRHLVFLRYKPGNTFPLIQNGDFNQGATNWTLTGNVAIGSGATVFNSGNTTPNGIVTQVCQTEIGSQYNLQYTTTRSGGGAGTMQILAEVRDNATNTLLASQLSPQAAGSTIWNIPFTARGTTLIKFIDQSLATNSVDIWVDNVSLSRYVQNG